MNNINKNCCMHYKHKHIFKCSQVFTKDRKAVNNTYCNINF